MAPGISANDPPRAPYFSGPEPPRPAASHGHPSRDPGHPFRRRVQANKDAWEEFEKDHALATGFRHQSVWPHARVQALDDLARGVACKLMVETGAILFEAQQFGNGAVAQFGGPGFLGNFSKRFRASGLM